MAMTIWDSISIFPGNDSAVATAKYVVDHWGFNLQSYTEEDAKIPARELKNKDNILGVVVRDYPEIMKELWKNGHPDSPARLWQISRISEQGVTFYLVNLSDEVIEKKFPDIAEAFIFIPMSNVIAIHDVSERFLLMNQEV